MQMSTRVIIGIIFFCVAMTGIFLGNIFTMMMIGEINRKRQEGNLISYFGFTPLKSVQILREYRSSYPDGKLHIYSLAAVALMIIGMIGVAVCIGIIGPKAETTPSRPVSLGPAVDQWLVALWHLQAGV